MSITSRPLDTIQHWKKEGYLLLDPPYQRGDVWGYTRRKNLIRSILLGIPIPSIVVNDRFAAGWGEEISVIDGKQRMTTLLQFLTNELEIPGEWYDLSGLVKFLDLPKPEQRRFSMAPIPFCESRLLTLEDEKEVFDLINFGGVPQGESD